VPDHWWSEAWAVFVKDIRSELRTRAALSTILLFSLVVLLITAFLMTTHGYGLDRVLRPVEEIRRIAAENPTFKETDITQAYPGTSFARASILSALLWITLFFSAMAGLPRAFVKEEEMRTAAALRLAARPSAVLAGSATILGAIVAQAGGKSYLMLPLAFPIVLPILVFTIKGSTSAMLGNPGNQVVGLVSYTVAMVTLSAMLFDKVWGDA
jgi:heme exporter protein B